MQVLPPPPSLSSSAGLLPPSREEQRKAGSVSSSSSPLYGLVKIITIHFNQINLWKFTGSLSLQGHVVVRVTPECAFITELLAKKVEIVK